VADAVIEAGLLMPACMLVEGAICANKISYLRPYETEVSAGSSSGVDRAIRDE
jgi:hypothetical protein